MEIASKLDELAPPYLVFVLDGEEMPPLPWATPQGFLARMVFGTDSPHMLWGALLILATQGGPPPRRVELWALWEDPPRRVKVAEAGEEALKA